MFIKSVKIKNVRSFKEETVFLPKEGMNVLIGANGSGKSNLLDIVYMALREFIVRPYNFIKSEQAGITTMWLNEVTPFGDIRQVLSKYTGDNSPTELTFQLQVTEHDVENIKALKDNREKLNGLIAIFSNTGMGVRNYLLFAPETFTPGEVFTYEIKDYRLPDPTDDNRRKIYLFYLKSIEGFMAISDMVGISLHPVLQYFSPFRSFNNASLNAVLSSTNYATELPNVIKAYSRTSSSLIKLATIYFASKHRRMEMNPNGYEAAWRNDADVKLVSETLSLLGYSWNLDLEDRDKNIYIIKLSKDGKEYQLSQASSGEVELINFIFGLITLGLRDGVIIIDEPELHLHPQWVAVLRNFFMRFALEYNNQIYVSTHSATFINSASYPFITRVFKDEHNISRIHQIKPEEITSDSRDLLHFIHATNNEKVFFSDFVVMVEGDTDELVFRRVISDVRCQRKSRKDVEVIQIRGKNNYEKFKAFLGTLSIPCCFIGDVDNVNQMAEGRADIKSLLVTNESRVARMVIKNPSSYDNVQLVSELDKAIRTGDTASLQEFWQYMLSFRTKIKSQFTAEEQKTLNAFIEELKDKRIYLLSDGEIEDYFPEGFKHKDLMKVLELLKPENYQEWQKQQGYAHLYALVDEIYQRQMK